MTDEFDKTLPPRRQEEAKRKQEEAERQKMKAVFKKVAIFLLIGVSVFGVFYSVYEKAEERRLAEEMERLAAATASRIDLGNGVKLEMVKIKAGTFMMGSPEGELGREYDEKQHRVTLTQDYWLGKFEVTQAQYEAITGKNPSYYKGSNRPVRVSWYDAKAFCDKLNERYAGKLPRGYKFDLPTEAQWEYACRAGTTTALNNGTNLTSKDGKCYNNVEEWCRGRYGSYSGDTTDPVGASDGYYRVGRGGGWIDSRARRCRSARRGDYGPQCRRSASHICYDSSCSHYFLGFRLALVPIQ